MKIILTYQIANVQIYTVIKIKKVLEKFKDENNNFPITEFIALNPKVYSLSYQCINEECTDLEITNKKSYKKCI